MKKIDVGQTVSIFANLGVIAGLGLLAVEIRTNTATNRISMYQASNANWMQINGTLATDEELVALIGRAASGEPLGLGERFQFDAWVRQQMSHSDFVLRLYDSGLYSEAEFRQEFSWMRSLARRPAIREYVQRAEGADRLRSLILVDEDEFSRLLEDR
jgi:hypothetical protein